MPPKTKPKKPKKLTASEKKLRAECKKDLQEMGILPPDKPRLNRKKFAAEVWQEFNEKYVNLDGAMELMQSLGTMVDGNMITVSEEQVGVLKLMKITMETLKFKQKLKDEGRSQYSMKELLEVIEPIWKL